MEIRFAEIDKTTDNFIARSWSCRCGIYLVVEQVAAPIQEQEQREHRFLPGSTELQHEISDRASASCDATHFQNCS